jgi:hypothetical protein
MEWFSNRLREPSTWAGIVTLVSGALHIGISDAMSQAITAIGVAVGGLVAVVIAERER